MVNRGATRLYVDDASAPEAPRVNSGLAPVAQWIERSPPEREVASSNLAGRA